MRNLGDINLSLKGAIVAGDVATVRVLLENGANVNAKDRDGVSILMHAINFEHLGVVKLLLSHGADISLRYHGKTPLMYAVEQNKTEIVEILKQHGATY
jgi:ankyrin repeat protein